MDMWRPYITSTRRYVPEADHKIAFDKFHVAKQLGDAVDRVRRRESKELRAAGDETYHLRRPWPNAAGATCLVLGPSEFLRRLAALVPAPYTNLVRYHGVFASRSQWRARLPEPPGRDTDAVAPPARQHAAANTPDPATLQAPTAAPTPQPLPETCTRRRRSLPWAQLLMRVFFIDALTCPRCETSMVVLALISDPEVVRKILLHLGLPVDVPPTAPAGPSRVEEPFFADDAPSDEPARPPP